MDGGGGWTGVIEEAGRVEGRGLKEAGGERVEEGENGEEKGWG